MSFLLGLLACFLFFFVVDGQLVGVVQKVKSGFRSTIQLACHSLVAEQDDALFMVFDDHGAVDVLEVLVVVPLSWIQRATV